MKLVSNQMFSTTQPISASTAIGGASASSTISTICAASDSALSQMVIATAPPARPTPPNIRPRIQIAAAISTMPPACTIAWLSGPATSPRAAASSAAVTSGGAGRDSRRLANNQPEIPLRTATSAAASTSTGGGRLRSINRRAAPRGSLTLCRASAISGWVIAGSMPVRLGL
jgi:hypothetical protein